MKEHGLEVQEVTGEALELRREEILVDPADVNLPVAEKLPGAEQMSVELEGVEEFIVFQGDNVRGYVALGESEAQVLSVWGAEDIEEVVWWE